MPLILGLASVAQAQVSHCGLQVASPQMGRTELDLSLLGSLLINADRKPANVPLTPPGPCRGLHCSRGSEPVPLSDSTPPPSIDRWILSVESLSASNEPGTTFFEADPPHRLDPPQGSLLRPPRPTAD